MAWLQEHHDRLWDKQIENDLAAGRLDALMSKAEDEYRQGLAQAAMKHLALPCFWRCYRQLPKDVQ